MDKDSYEYKRAIELLTYRCPLAVEQAEQLFDILTGTRDHRIHRSIANYLANEAGYDRDRIAEILDARIEARNVDHMVRQHVERYFHMAPEGTNRTETCAEEAIRAEVQRYVRKKLDEGASAYIDAMAHELSVRLFGQIPGQAPAREKPYEPGLQRHAHAVTVGWGRAAAAAVKWLDGFEPVGGPDVESAPDTGDRFDAWRLVVKNPMKQLGDTAFGKLAGTLDACDMQTLERCAYGSWSVPRSVKLRLLSQEAGFQAEWYAAYNHGLAVLSK